MAKIILELKDIFVFSLVCEAFSTLITILFVSQLTVFLIYDIFVRFINQM
jgi:hypothetical protein